MTGDSASAPLSHALTDADLSALAVGEFTTKLVLRLRAAEYSKHALLLEALRRATRECGHRGCAEIVEAAVELLSRVQTEAPDAVADVLMLPHFGFWAARCLFRLRAGRTTGPRYAGTPLSLDIAHLATFAAVAALRADCPFDLVVPVRDGAVTLPTMGRAQVDLPGNSGWARIHSGERGAVVGYGNRTVDLPADAVWAADTGRVKRAGLPRWTLAYRLHAAEAGLSLNATLDAVDPFLTKLGPPVADHRQLPIGQWQERMAEAWRILVRHHEPVASALAAGLTTLVPARESAPGFPVTATSGWAWGAIALSLPPDAILFAEALVHEFHHLVLAAVEDLTPLEHGGDGQLHCAPWRDDPRPVAGLLQGTYAFFGVTAFWRTQRLEVPARHRLRAEVEFARGRRDVLEAARTLARSSALTEAGRVFAVQICDRLVRWQQEFVPAEAELMAVETSAEHRLRWRLAHTRAHADAIETLARAWIAGQLRPPDGLNLAVTLEPRADSLPQDRSHLLELRYRDPARFERRLADTHTLSTPDAALLRGEYGRAKDGYLREVAAGDVGAWVGFVLARRKLAGRASDWPVRERPEVLAALYERVRQLTGEPPAAEALIEWLDG